MNDTGPRCVVIDVTCAALLAGSAIHLTWYAYDWYRGKDHDTGQPLAPNGWAGRLHKELKPRLDELLR